MWRSFGSGVVGSIASGVIVLCGRVFSWECAVVKREVRCGILFQREFLMGLITNQAETNFPLLGPGCWAGCNWSNNQQVKHLLLRGHH